MKKLLIFSTVISFIGTTPLLAETKTPTASDTTTQTTQAEDTAHETEQGSVTSRQSDVVCKLGEDTRTIAKKPGTEGGCIVAYTRNGETNTVATANNDLSYCDTTVEKIKSNLTAAGFTCE